MLNRNIKKIYSTLLVFIVSITAIIFMSQVASASRNEYLDKIYIDQTKDLNAYELNSNVVAQYSNKKSHPNKPKKPWGY